jgi:hypothetical protein
MIGGLMIVTGSQKVLATVPPEALVRYGLGEQVHLIGWGALASAILLLTPNTSLLGILLTSSFWGGAICTHMAHGEPYVFQATVLALSWAGAYLRNPRAPGSLSAPLGLACKITAASEPSARWLGAASGCGVPETSVFPENSRGSL